MFVGPSGGSSPPSPPPFPFFPSPERAWRDFAPFSGLFRRIRSNSFRPTRSNASRKASRANRIWIYSSCVVIFEREPQINDSTHPRINDTKSWRFGKGDPPLPSPPLGKQQAHYASETFDYVTYDCVHVQRKPIFPIHTYLIYSNLIELEIINKFKKKKQIIDFLCWTCDELNDFQITLAYPLMKLNH